MNRQVKTVPGFTIVDMFILLLAALVAYSGFYWSMAQRAQKPSDEIREAALAALLPYKSLGSLAQPGQKLYDSAENEVGKIISASEKEQEDGKTVLYLTCEITGGEFYAGELYRLSTKTLCAEFQVDQISVPEITATAQG